MLRLLHPAGFAVLGLLLAVPVTPASADEDLRHWSRLRFAHTGLARSAELDLHRELQGVTALPADDSGLPDALAPVSAAVGRLVVRNHFRVSVVFRRTRETELWFDPVNHAALLGLRETTGFDAGYRRSRYGREGVVVSRSRPATAAERGAAPRHWTAHTDTRTDYGPDARDCAAVSEPLILLLIEPSSLPADLCLLVKGKLLRAVFSPPEVETAGMEVRLHRADGTTGSVYFGQAHRHRLHLERRDGSEGDPAAEAFPGLRGEVELLVDAASSTPLRLQGTAALAGKVDFRLQEIRLTAD